MPKDPRYASINLEHDTARALRTLTATLTAERGSRVTVSEAVSALIAARQREGSLSHVVEAIINEHSDFANSLGTNTRIPEDVRIEIMEHARTAIDLMTAEIAAIYHTEET